MIRPRVRPRLNRTYLFSSEEALDRFKEALSKKEGNVIGRVVQHHVHLKIIPKELHYWSPELHMEIEEHEDGSLVRGLFGPRPAVWTMFMFFCQAHIKHLFLSGK